MVYNVSHGSELPWLVVWLPFHIFPYIGNNHPNWLIFFRGVQTTNQYHFDFFPGTLSIFKIRRTGLVPCPGYRRGCSKIRMKTSKCWIRAAKNSEFELRPLGLLQPGRFDWQSCIGITLEKKQLTCWPRHGLTPMCFWSGNGVFCWKGVFLGFSKVSHF